MNEITEDRWDEDLWGAAERKEGSPRPKLVFYFGKDDHWVADHSRDELIAARAFQKGQLEGWRPKMLVDDEGIPHSFCISESVGHQSCLDKGADTAKGTARRLRGRWLGLLRRLSKLIMYRHPSLDNLPTPTTSSCIKYDHHRNASWVSQKTAERTILNHPHTPPNPLPALRTKSANTSRA